MNKKNIDIKKTLLDNGIIIVLLLLVLITGITKDNFFSWNNLSNISVNTAARVIIAFGVSGCLITKGTDLSAGRMVGLASCIAGTLLQTADYSGKFFPNLGDMPVFGVLALCILICCIFGLINGIVIAYLNVPAFIALWVCSWLYTASAWFTPTQLLWAATAKLTPQSQPANCSGRSRTCSSSHS